MSPKGNFSIRVPVISRRIKILEEKGIKIGETKIRDLLYKPIGVSLDKYYPDRICFRLRKFLTRDQPATLAEIKIDSCEKLTDEKKILARGKIERLIKKARQLGYEKWGETTTESVDYQLRLKKNLLIFVFWQKIKPVGEFLKIESPTMTGLEETLALLSVKPGEEIAKNAAVLLAEKIKQKEEND